MLSASLTTTRTPETCSGSERRNSTRVTLPSFALSTRKGTRPMSGIGIGSLLLRVVVTLDFTALKPVRSIIPTAKMPRAPAAILIQ